MPLSARRWICGRAPKNVLASIQIGTRFDERVGTKSRATNRILTSLNPETRLLGDITFLSIDQGCGVFSNRARSGDPHDRRLVDVHARAHPWLPNSK